MSLRLIDTAEVERAVTMRDVMDRVRQALLDAEADGFEMPLRSSFGDGQALVMPIFHRATATTAVKSLSINPDRDPRIVGSLSWSAPEQEEILVIDAEAVTTLRTGAVVALATDLLAAPAAARLVVFGAGAQAGDQVRGVAAVRDLADVTLLSPTPERGNRLAADLAAELPAAQVRWVASESDDAVAVLAAAEIVCCATPATEPLFAVDGLSSEVHVNAIGSFRPSMQELPVDLLGQATTIAVDDRTGCLAESGELVAALEAGAITAESVRSLADLFGTPPERPGRTVFKSVGAATLDWAAMAAVSSAVV